MLLKKKCQRKEKIEDIEKFRRRNKKTLDQLKIMAKN